MNSSTTTLVPSKRRAAAPAAVERRFGGGGGHRLQSPPTYRRVDRDDQRGKRQHTHRGQSSIDRGRDDGSRSTTRAPNKAETNDLVRKFYRVARSTSSNASNSNSGGDGGRDAPGDRPAKAWRRASYSDSENEQRQATPALMSLMKSGDGGRDPRRRGSFGSLSYYSDCFSSESESDSYNDSRAIGRKSRRMDSSDNFPTWLIGDGKIANRRGCKSSTGKRYAKAILGVVVLTVLGASVVYFYLAAEVGYKSMDGPHIDLFGRLFGKHGSSNTVYYKEREAEPQIQLRYRKLPQGGTVLVLGDSPGVTGDQGKSFHKSDVALARHEIKPAVPASPKSMHTHQQKSGNDDMSPQERNRREHLEKWKNE